jgi:hypothetical protein
VLLVVVDDRDDCVLSSTAPLKSWTVRNVMSEMINDTRKNENTSAFAVGRFPADDLIMSPVIVLVLSTATMMVFHLKITSNNKHNYQIVLSPSCARFTSFKKDLVMLDFLTYSTVYVFALSCRSCSYENIIIRLFGGPKGFCVRDGGSPGPKPEQGPGHRQVHKPLSSKPRKPVKSTNTRLPRLHQRSHSSSHPVSHP